MNAALMNAASDERDTDERGSNKHGRDELDSDKRRVGNGRSVISVIRRSSPAACSRCRVALVAAAPSR
jgi:hypothetical protein